MSNLKIYKNPNEEEYNEITEAVKLNDNYCPCMTERSDSTKCMCEAFRKLDRADYCHCGRYYKVPQFETLVLIANVTDDGDEVFIGRDLAHTKSYAEKTAAAIDEEVKKIVNDCYEKAKEIIIKHKDVLEKCAELLIEKEKIGREEFESLFEQNE